MNDPNCKLAQLRIQIAKNMTPFNQLGGNLTIGWHRNAARPYIHIATAVVLRYCDMVFWIDVLSDVGEFAEDVDHFACNGN